MTKYLAKATLEFEEIIEADDSATARELMIQNFYENHLNSFMYERDYRNELDFEFTVAIKNSE